MLVSSVKDADTSPLLERNEKKAMFCGFSTRERAKIDVCPFLGSRLHQPLLKVYQNQKGRRSVPFHALPLPCRAAKARGLDYTSPPCSCAQNSGFTFNSNID